MGRLTKLAAGLLGLLLIESPLWPVALVCFAYLAFALMPGRSATENGVRRRHALAAIMFGLALVALVSGGTFTPDLFFLGGALVFFWPSLWPLFPLGEVVAVKDSTLLRSRCFPFAWHALAELKPGSESFPRAVSSFTGTLLVFTDTGKAFALATCLAKGRKEAEERLTFQLKSALPGRGSGAYLLPLDAEAAAEALRQRLSRVALPDAGLVKTAALISGALVLECDGANVQAAGAFADKGSARAAVVPGHGGRLDSAPLVWEVLDAVGKRTHWPEPDAFSNLLDSLNATKGVPLGERLKTIEISDDAVSLESLGGALVRVTRPQLRAIVSLYS